jgi:hypothetical protein
MLYTPLVGLEPATDTTPPPPPPSLQPHSWCVGSVVRARAYCSHIQRSIDNWYHHCIYLSSANGVT